MKTSLYRQRGISLIAVIFVLFIAIWVTVVAVKLGPDYMEYLTIRSVMNEQQEASSSETSRAQVLADIGKRLYVNGVKAVNNRDFKYKKTTNGYLLSIEYDVQKHLAGNVDVVMHFDHQIEVDTKK